MAEEWMSIAEAAKRFCLPERTLRYNVERGKLKAERRGRAWFIAIPEIKPEIMKVAPVVVDNTSNISKLPPPRKTWF